MEMSHETVQSVLVDADTHTNAHTQTDAQVYTERRLKRSHVDKEKQGSEGDWGRERDVCIWNVRTCSKKASKKVLP